MLPEDHWTEHTDVVVVGSGATAVTLVPAMAGLDFHRAFLACLYSGLVAVPVNFRMTPPEIAFLVSDCQAEVVITEVPDHVELLATLNPDEKRSLVAVLK